MKMKIVLQKNLKNYPKIKLEEMNHAHVTLEKNISTVMDHFEIKK